MPDTGRSRTCAYRYAPGVPLRECGWTGTRADLLRHLAEDHAVGASVALGLVEEQDADQRQPSDRSV